MKKDHCLSLKKINYILFFTDDLVSLNLYGLIMGKVLDKKINEIINYIVQN